MAIGVLSLGLLSLCLAYSFGLLLDRATSIGFMTFVAATGVLVGGFLGQTRVAAGAMGLVLGQHSALIIVGLCTVLSPPSIQNLIKIGFAGAALGVVVGVKAWGTHAGSVILGAVLGVILGFDVWGALGNALYSEAEIAAASFSLDDVIIGALIFLVPPTVAGAAIGGFARGRRGRHIGSAAMGLALGCHVGLVLVLNATDADPNQGDCIIPTAVGGVIGLVIGGGPRVRAWLDLIIDLLRTLRFVRGAIRWLQGPASLSSKLVELAAAIAAPGEQRARYAEEFHATLFGIEGRLVWWRRLICAFSIVVHAVRLRAENTKDR